MNLPLSKNGVDTHFHVFHAGEAVRGARYVPPYSALLMDWMQQAQSVGVSRGVWVQPSFLGTNNQLMVSALQTHPDMLRGVAVVSPDVRADELQLLHGAGVRGIRLNLSGVSHDIPEWTHAEAVWEALHDLGWHVEVHTDQGLLPQVLSQLPADMPLVVDHMGKPAQARSDDPSLKALARHAQRVATHVKLSGAYRLGGLHAPTLVQSLLDTLGPSALLWGSDWPCTNHEPFAHFETLMADAQAWLNPETLEQVLVRNPLQLYWGLQEGVATTG